MKWSSTAFGVTLDETTGVIQEIRDYRDIGNHNLTDGSNRFGSYSYTRQDEDVRTHNKPPFNPYNSSVSAYDLLIESGDNYALFENRSHGVRMEYRLF